MPSLKSKGLNWELELKHRKPEDHLGGFASCIAEIPEEERELSLPAGERQNIGEEKMDCASRSVNNILEAKLNWLLKNGKLPEGHVKFLEPYLVNGKVELSDRWIAIMSGTDPDAGNSLIAPLDAMHTYGIVPKTMFPQVDSKAEYYGTENITEEIERIAKESLNYFNFNYSRLSESEFPQFLVRDMLNVGGYAWPPQVNDEYPKVDLRPNHAFVVWKNPRYFAFDNYEESSGDFVKKLAEDYDFLDTGYRIRLSLNDHIKRNWFALLLEWLFGTHG